MEYLYLSEQTRKHLRISDTTLKELQLLGIVSTNKPWDCHNIGGGYKVLIRSIKIANEIIAKYATVSA
jgi:hypothetical protein